LVAVLASTYIESWNRHENKPAGIIGIFLHPHALVVAYLFLLCLLPFYLVIKRGNEAFNRLEHHNFLGKNKSEISRKILEYAQPGDRMTVWGWANQYHVETGLPQGVRYANSGVVIKKHRYFSKKYSEDLEKNKPAIFVDAAVSSQKYYKKRSRYGPGKFPKIRAFIDSNYNYADIINRVRIYVRKDIEIDKVLRQGIDDITIKAKNIDDLILPKETKNIKHYVLIKENEESFVIDNGYAFIENINSRHNRVWLVLKSAEDTLIYPTKMVQKHELSRIHKTPFYIHSGLEVRVPKKDLKGYYQVGFLITSGPKIRGLQFTNKTVFWHPELTTDKLETELVNLVPSEDIKYYIPLIENDSSFTINNGWAYLPQINSRLNRIYLVLKSSGVTKLYATKLTKAQGLDKKTKNNLYSGFAVEIPKKDLIKGDYIIGILITRGDNRWLTYTEERLIKLYNDIDDFKDLGEIGKVQSYIFLQEDFNSFYIDNGWAFVEGVKSDKIKTFVILKSDTSFFLYPTQSIDRFELGNLYSLDYVKSGIRWRVNKKEIPKGTYQIGLALINSENQNIQGFHYLDKTLDNRSNLIGGFPINELITQHFEISEKTQGLKQSFKLEEDSLSIFINDGWAFIEGLESKGTQVYLVIQSEESAYIFNTNKKRRHELAKIYSTQQVDAGFTLKVKKEDLKRGKYNMGILIAQDDQIIGFKFTKRYLII